MLRCEYYCLFCYEPQTLKLNLIKIHGVCQTHLDSLTDFSLCSHCKSIVPIISNQTSSPEFPNSSQLCEYCFENPDLTSLDCHKICKTCYKSSCPICRTSSIPSFSLCDYCQKADICEKKTCSHSLCKNCYSQICQVCDLVNHSTSFVSQNPDIFCEYCCTSKYGLDCDSGHKLCKDCFVSACPLCESRSTLGMGVCEACLSVNDDKYVCKKNHSLCEKCRISCIFCNGELNTEKTDKICGDIYRGTEKIDCKKDKQVVDLTKASEFWRIMKDDKRSCELVKEEKKVIEDCKGSVKDISHNEEIKEEINAEENKEKRKDVDKESDRKESKRSKHPMYENELKNYKGKGSGLSNKKNKKDEEKGDDSCRCIIL